MNISHQTQKKYIASIWLDALKIKMRRNLLRKFTILKDGTIVTDSDYLPNDVNERAHDAMDVLEQLLGNKRVMTKKPIPAKYAGKFKPRRVNIQTIEQK